MTTDIKDKIISDFICRFHTFSSVFGDDWFLSRQTFARILVRLPSAFLANAVCGHRLDFIERDGVAKFDSYPFILLNLAFETPGSLKAPLILLRANPAGRP